MKILFVASRLSNLGPINQMYNLISHINMERYDVSVVTIFPERENSRKRDFEKKGIHIHCLNICHKWEYHKMIYRLRKVVQESNPDVLHAEGLPADVITSFQKGTFLTSTIHCDIYTDYYFEWGKKFPRELVTRLFIKLHEWSLRKKDLLICCSEYLKPIYEKKDFEKVAAVQNGVNFENGATFITDDEKQLIKKKLGLVLEKKIVLVVGRLCERKDPFTIIKAANSLIDQSEWQFVFLGEGECIEECKRIKENPNIIFKGKVSNVEEYLLCSDVYVSASLSEGLPMSVLEAGSYGLKMVLSDIPQHREIIHGECQGISFFEVEENEDLADKLRECFNMFYEQRMEIRDYFYTYFSSDKMAEKYCELYEFYLKRNQDDLYL